MYWIVLLLPLVFSQCTLFDIRDAEEPVGEGSDVYRLPTSPENTLFNFRYALTRVDAEQYSECLADTSFPDSYTYLPDALHASAGFFTDWSVEHEFQFLYALSQLQTGVYADSLPQLQFLLPSWTMSGDSARYEADYELIVATSDTLINGCYEGEIRLFFSNLGLLGNWAIYRWEDESTDQQNSFSDLKVRISR